MKTKFYQLKIITNYNIMNTLNKKELKVYFQKFERLIKINDFLRTKKIITQI